jgi:hypothetical protein
MTSKAINNGLRKIKGMLRRAATSVEEIAEGGEPVATPPPGATSGRLGDPDRETSTNAQLEGAAEEPWGGNR